MPSYNVPALTVHLGTVLDAVIEHKGLRYTVKRWHGLQMLTNPNAFEITRPKLFLVRGRLERPVRLEPGAHAGPASDTYERWHQRENERVGELVTKVAKYPQGRMVVIGYRSDKWGPRGKRHDYSHDFFEDGGRPPLVYTDTRALDAASTVVVVGGSMTIAEGGIS